MKTFDLPAAVRLKLLKTTPNKEHHGDALVQAISRGDAMAEGCPFANMAAGPDPRDWYRDLWNEINGPGAWGLSPWVWVVAFKVVKP